MKKRTFHLRADHLKLLEKLNICWNNGKYGGPEVNREQPFNDQSTESFDKKLCQYLDLDVNSQDDIEYAREIYNQLDTAMKIVFSSRTFSSGVFEADKNNDNWKRMAVEHDGNCPSCDKRVSLSIASMYGEWHCSECDVKQAISLDR